MFSGTRVHAHAEALRVTLARLRGRAVASEPAAAGGDAAHPARGARFVVAGEAVRAGGFAGAKSLLARRTRSGAFWTARPELEVHVNTVLGTRREPQLIQAHPNALHELGPIRVDALGDGLHSTVRPDVQGVVQRRRLLSPLELRADVATRPEVTRGSERDVRLRRREGRRRGRAAGEQGPGSRRASPQSPA
jgi:hypothetical protein